MNSTELKTLAKGAFDKILLAVALLGLMLSLTLLIVKVQGERLKMEAFSREQEASNHQVRPPRLLDMAFLDDAVEALLAPLQLPAGLMRIMVAERRVACVQCGRPIPPAAGKCPYVNCGAEQPVAAQAPARDADADGMPDDWEKQHGLNPMVDDAHQDADGDGFTNLEEFLAGTRPDRADSHPDYLTKLRALKIGRTPMPLSFQGVQRLGDDLVQFQIKNRLLRRDTYAKLGDTVDGYLLVSYEPKKVPVSKGTFTVEEDVSVLVVRRDNKDIPLTIYKENQGEIGATLVSLLDLAVWPVTVGAGIEFKNNSYKVVDIDDANVILTDAKTGVRTAVPLISDAERQLYPDLK